MSGTCCPGDGTCPCQEGPRPAAISDARNKLLELDGYRHAAAMWIVDWLRDEPEVLCAMARGRHAEGHYRYGDTLMYEYDAPTLTAEAAQELADAINYVALRLLREATQ